MTKFFIRPFTALVWASLCLACTYSYGQTLPDTLRMQEIEVTATRIRQPLKLQPVHIDVIDSARLSFFGNEDIGSLLSMESGLFIKSNGPGGLATASQRGLSPEQIQVLWEGIPINHAMLGQADLSLLPSSFFSDVEVSSGVPSSAFGGGLSGGLYLNSDFKKANRVSLSQSAGSFGQYRSGLQASIHQDDWSVSLRSQYTDAKNDYRYFNRAYQQAERRNHNRQQQRNVMASVGYEKKMNKFHSTLWFEDSDNQIPGNVLNTHSRAQQNDDALRWLSSYQTKIGGTRITAKNYLERIGLDYVDPQIDVQSLSTTRRWLVSTELQNQLSNGVNLKGELSGSLTGVETNNYTELKTRRRFSALLNPEFYWLDYRFKIYPALRFDSYNDFGNVLSPSLGLNYELLYDKLYLHGQLSRDFNAPTFNALYWPQGGNPDLKPERSKNAEGGIAATFSNKVLQRIDLTGFYTRVHNGIRWYPNQAGTYMPSNVQEIATKGLELSTKSRFNLPENTILTIKQNGSLTRSEIAAPRFAGDAAVGYQMRYVPEWSYKASLQVQHQWASALLSYRWVSRRYITDTEDAANSLDPYQKVDLAMQAHQRWRGITFTGNLQLNNLLNADYEIVQFYAMPQRNIQFTITATYNF